MRKVSEAVVIVYYLVLIGVILWSLSDEPVSPAIWRQTTRFCQAWARYFGTLGLHAEQSYYDAVERSRL